MKRELILNTRYGEFKLGASIDEYKQMPHHMDIYEEESFSYECYVFEQEGVELWCEKGIVNTIFPWEGMPLRGERSLEDEL